MKCSRCQHENPADAVFCQECGKQLEPACPGCGTANQLGAKFCKKCGQPVAMTPPATAGQKFPSPEAYTPKHLAEKILTSKSALEGERKQVTVLFVDVSGFTSISDRLDPEDVHGLMTRAFELMLAEVHRYEGTVNQFLGDGIMALFGAPIAHEDHAQRAVHSALGIQRTLESYRTELERRRVIQFRVRQGLNTGLVVVGSIGTDLRMDYTAVGDTTNVAARMLQIADAGRIVIAEATHRLAGNYFHTRPLGPLPLKGKTEPVRAWEVISPRSARTRLDVEAERGLTPFVGRDRELRVLTECFDKVAAGRGQVVFIVGEPGIGKSRLLLEFQRHLGERATWVEGRSISFGRSIAFHPLIDLLRRTFRIEESDHDSAIIEKIERGVLRLGADLRSTLPYLRHLLAVDPGDPAVQAMDPQLRRAEVFEAIRRLLLRAAEIWPQVVVYEDVHWMDQATEEYLGLMADIIATSRVLMILTYRPGYVPPFGDRSYYTRLAVTALSTEASAEMTCGMLAAERLPDALQTLVAQKAEGNPFFVEEVVKSLQELGAIRLEPGSYALTRMLDEVVVPDTIQDVIMARIDRLAEAPKKTLQLASVIGREFTRRLLDRISDIRGQTEQFLRELKGIELIYEKSLFPELAYMFKHALTHDVAYNSLLVQRRKELHQLIAMAVEELYADRLADQYEVLAHHFSKAEDWPRALDYLMKAAEKAAQGFANREALALLTQAEQIAAQLGKAVDPRALLGIHQAKAALYLVLSDFERSRQEGQRALELARRLGDRPAEGAVLAAMGLAAMFAHDFAPALEYSGQAIAVAGGEVQAVAAAGHMTTGWVHTATGFLGEGRPHIDSAIALARSARDVFHTSLALCVAGQHENWVGQCDRALQFQTEGLRLAREHNLPFPLLVALFSVGMTTTTKGQYEGGRALFEEGVSFAEKVGDEIFRLRFLNCLGWLHLELGGLEMSLELNRQGADGAKKRGDPETWANSAINLGDVFMAKGDLVLADEILNEVLRSVDDSAVSEMMKWRYSMHVFASLADLWLAQSDLDKARTFTDRCLEVATRTMSRKYLARGWRLRGEIAFVSRAWDESETALREALAIAERVGNPTQLWKTHAALGRLYATLRRPEASSKAYRSAANVVNRIKASIDDPKLAETLANAPAVRDLYQRAGSE
jgi:class 3 adenylate cyclase/tetratricopeptide (TPR) repeat protein